MHESQPLGELGFSQSPKSPEPTPPTAENLQFQTAEFAATDATPHCVLCSATVAGDYYHLDGKVICTQCAVQKQANMEPVRGAVLGKSALYGLGAALAGSALYGVVLLATGAEFALLSILVGIMVGKAMTRGSGGRGGRKLQIVAVLLTYGAITTGYIPTIVKAFSQIESKKKSAAPNQTAIVHERVRPGRAVLAVGVLLAFVIGLALISPFLIVMQGFSGILSVIIIFFGLQQAWRRTRADHAILMGPYPASDLIPPVACA